MPLVVIFMKVIGAVEHHLNGVWKHFSLKKTSLWLTLHSYFSQYLRREILNNSIINTSSVRFDRSGGMMSCFSRLKVFLKVKYLQDNYTLLKWQHYRSSDSFKRAPVSEFKLQPGFMQDTARGKHHILFIRFLWFSCLPNSWGHTRLSTGPKKSLNIMI